jgi:dCMP deaminase
MNWERYALELARVAAMKSKDPWRQVGAVVLRHDKTVAGVGYNGFPSGVEEDWECREKRRLFVVHAGICRAADLETKRDALQSLVFLLLCASSSSAW